MNLYFEILNVKTVKKDGDVLVEQKEPPKPDHAGYTEDLNSGYVWSPLDGQEMFYATATEALQAAWADASAKAMKRFGIPEDEWSRMPFATQARLIGQ